ncbi:MAG: helix-turn-helix domain-containing protein [Actinobacteria bacterium]|nr:helix-turn-helix domain-containing protein [Actinomycetota bacterium]
MTANTRLTDDERRNIIDILTETENVAETARRTGRSASTVSLLGRQHGINVAARTRTARACEAAKLDAAARRATLALGFLDDAERLRAQLFAPMVVTELAGKIAAHVQTEVTEPSPSDKRALMNAATSAARSAMELDRHDRTPDAGSEIPMLVQFVDGLRAVADESDRDEPGAVA